MTKKELADVIHTKIGLSKRESAEIDRLSRGEGIKLPRFGSFRVQNRKARKGRNPATGETIEIAERKAVVFKPSRFLRDSIDKHTD